MKKIKIGVFTGSLRRASFCKKTALAVSALMPEEFEMVPVEIGSLAMYNQDFDDFGNPPGEYSFFRQEVKMLDGLLFITPEYNRSIPPVLKNALDIGSRPYGHNIWNNKPGAIISVSIGKMGGFGANHQLRQAMVFLNIFLMQQPEAYIGEVASLFDDQGEISNKSSRDFLKNYADAFARWVLRFKAA
ncbi:probable NADPH:quinone oxidoreductase 2 [Treponema primitia ZAS-2]|uniref:Probable NADPH:quinone oxidoreductase 2 n=1 Tax=Treponema primitia (strain ATCC BAA-887 / DSM 12427 / ZAS-2) TaxID=545694 RepID=F5YII3_TREPZ|nr:NAD(P)H-dependent oxidoreductase [Treponema primitia]AEF83634.1 probable NADPH:quinone oxidoreductase 2 [Treponema primitia ZAS-2]